MPPRLKSAGWRAVQAGAPILISAVALVWIGQSMDWRAVAADAMRAPAWAVATCIGLVFAQLTLCGWRLMRLSASVGAPVSREPATAVWGVSYLAGLTLPSSIGSELVKGGLLLRWMRFPGRILGVLALERLLALIAMGLVVLLATPVLAWAAHRQETAWVTAVGGLGLFAVLGAFLLRRRLFRLMAQALQRVGVPKGACDGVEQTLNTAPLGAMTFVSALVHLLTLGMIGVLAAGLGAPNPWAIAFLGGPLVVLASMLPISVGGLGVREGAAIAVFGALGLGAEQAASIGLALWGSQLLAGALAAATAVVWMLVRRTAPAPT